MTDRDLLRAAIRAAGLSDRAFARTVLGFDNDRQVRRWLAGTSPTLHPTARVVCRAIVADPAVAGVLRAVS